MPQSVANIDPNFEGRLNDFRLHAAAAYTAGIVGGQRRWFRPAGWDGNVFDLGDALAAPFAADAATRDYLAAVTNNPPGTTGDVVATLTMIDTLATMERAFRVRHGGRRPRLAAHALGRLKGHGDPHGPLMRCSLEYTRAVLRQAKVAPPTQE